MEAEEELATDDKHLRHVQAVSHASVWNKQSVHKKDALGPSLTVDCLLAKKFKQKIGNTSTFCCCIVEQLVEDVLNRKSVRMIPKRGQRPPPLMTLQPQSMGCSEVGW